MLTDFPTFAQAQDAPDDERIAALAMQASLSADLVDPADALGDEAWAQMVMADAANGGAEALAGFRAQWNWEMTPQQRADMLSRAVMDREMKAFINASAVPRPVVDPLEFADGVRASRMERARGVVL